jgi:alpha-galactosidase
MVKTMPWAPRAKNFTISIGDLIGLTPALGWNSWNAFGLSVDDARVRVAAANTMIEKLSALTAGTT